jgi:hypothetical protein
MLFSIEYFIVFRKKDEIVSHTEPNTNKQSLVPPLSRLLWHQSFNKFSAGGYLLFYEMHMICCNDFFTILNILIVFNPQLIFLDSQEPKILSFSSIRGAIFHKLVENSVHS